MMARENAETYGTETYPQLAHPHLTHPHLTHAKRTLDRALYWVTAALFLALVVAVVWQVASRQVINQPSTWTDEASRMVFVWLGLSATALVFGERGHIAVEFLARKLPPRGERLMAVLVQVAVALFAVVIMIWGGILATLSGWNQALSILPVTFGHMYLALPVSGALILLYSLYYILQITADSVPAFTDIEAEELPATAPQRQDVRSRLLSGETSSDETPSGETPSGETLTRETASSERSGR